MSALDFAGLTHVFSAWWFVGLLLLLAASLAACSYKRYAAALRLHGRPRGRALGSLITHISMLLVLCGGVVRIWCGERGQLQFREGDTVESFSDGAKSIPLPFKLHLVKFTTEFHESDEPELLHLRIQGAEEHWSIPTKELAVHSLSPKGTEATPENTYQVTILKRVPDFVIDSASGQVESRSTEMNNPALQVQIVHRAATNTLWAFALHPGFNMHSGGEKMLVDVRYTIPHPTGANGGQVKDWKSTLQILEDGVVVKEKTIEVNSPLSYKGYTFYQSGYNPKDPKWTSLQVVRDPGVPLVYAGFFFLIVGLTMVFYLYPHGRHER